MANSEFWRNLAKCFRALPDPLRMLRADWHYRSAGNLVDPWQLTGGAPLELRTQFDALARRAASHLPQQSSSNLLSAWLDALKAQSVYFEYGRTGIELNVDGSEVAYQMIGSIGRVCEASASYCDVLEGEATEAEFQTRKNLPTPTPPISIPDVEKPNAPVTSVQTESPKPKDLWSIYSTQFAEKVVILDVCWAVHQRYREWKRWLSGELKAGSKPDKAFRALLSTSKRPEEYRQEPRPAKWQ